MIRSLIILVAISLTVCAAAQVKVVDRFPLPDSGVRQVAAPNSRQAIPSAAIPPSSTDVSGIRLKDIARFRGIRMNQLTGEGIVMGLEGTGDSNKVALTAQMLAQFFRNQGQPADPTTLQVKNVALVMVTAQLPPFAVNGQAIDVTVTSVGDARSLRNGTLLFTELKGPDGKFVYATASGAISVGGYSAAAGGNSQTQGFVTVGRIPAGGIVEREAPSTTVYDGKMYLQLDDPDLTTAHRVEQRLNEEMPELHAVAQDGSTIQVDLPTGLSATTAMARIESMTVQVDTPTLVVINERTGTIAMGGNVRLAPCAIATGSLSVKIEEQITASQPNPLSGGTTQVIKNQQLTAGENRAQVAVLKANTTIADLARIFQELRLKPADIINILQLLHDQGALKARVVTN